MGLKLPIMGYVDTKLDTIPSQTTIIDAERKMMELGADSVLVSKDDVISGIVTQTDIMKAISNEVKISDKVESIMSKPLITIDNTANVVQAIKIMKENNIRRLIVKEGSNLIGTITQKKVFGSQSSKAFEIPELELPKHIKCPYCSSLFLKKEELSKHIDQIHVGYGVFQGNFSRVEDLGSISSPDNYPKSL